MVTSAPCSQSAAAMSCAELLEPTTTHFLPVQPSPLVCFEEWCCVVLNVAMPGKLGMLGTPDWPVANTRYFGRSVIGLPSRTTSTVHSFYFSSYLARLHSVLVQ